MIEREARRIPAVRSSRGRSKHRTEKERRDSERATGRRNRGAKRRTNRNRWVVPSIGFSFNLDYFVVERTARFTGVFRRRTGMPVGRLYVAGVVFDVRVAIQLAKVWFLNNHISHGGGRQMERRHKLSWFQRGKQGPGLSPMTE